MTSIRSLRTTDKKAVIAIHRRSIYGLCKDYYSHKEMDAWTARLTPQLFDEGMKDENNIGVVAVDSAIVVGYGFINVKDREVRALYVLPGYAKQGAGRVIMGRLEELAREKKIESLKVQSTLNAVGFYRKAGYRETGREKHRINADVSIACVRMEKKLHQEGTV